jgi:hypothetical protein
VAFLDLFDRTARASASAIFIPAKTFKRVALLKRTAKLRLRLMLKNATEPYSASALLPSLLPAASFVSLVKTPYRRRQPEAHFVRDYLSGLAICPTHCFNPVNQID